MQTRFLITAVACLSGCVPDFSPDPYNETPLSERDAGSDASRPRRDASMSSSNNDDGEDMADSDDGDHPPDVVDAGDSKEDATFEVIDAGPHVSAGPCDLTGSWLMTERETSSGLGATQISYNWYYVELTQQGDKLTFARTLSCGAKVDGLFPVAISMDDKASWPAYQSHRSYEGRLGTSSAAGSGCTVSLEKAAVVRGATVEAYRDQSLPLPTVDEPAADGEPGWEDWDNDSKPGVSLRISGTITGTLYAATRVWTQASGDIDGDARSFQLPLNWGQQRSTLGYEGSSLLASGDASRDPDATKHTVEFARLSATQTSGDDTAKCAMVRDLAPTLTPNAMK